MRVQSGSWLPWIMLILAPPTLHHSSLLSPSSPTAACAAGLGPSLGGRYHSGVSILPEEPALLELLPQKPQAPSPGPC